MILITLLPFLLTVHAWRHPLAPRVPSQSSENFSRRASGDCISSSPQDTVTDRLNKALSSGGQGYKLVLCQGENYMTTAPIKFTAANQEISTDGYPTDSNRAMITVNGPRSGDNAHSVAVDGTCKFCNSLKLRNVQINGTRLGNPSFKGGANIEMGNSNADHLIEYVRSFDTRTWSCLHIAEGNLNCTGAIVQNNDIGPCGNENWNQWADGISFSCRNGIIKNNLVNNPTDGGIVLFGSPGTLVENNTIWVENNTLLGGINMVDYAPFDGNYTGTTVINNKIGGGFATDTPSDSSDTKGDNADNVIIKIGIAIGPRTWFGDRYGNNVSVGGIVKNNELTGAFGYAMAMSSARSFTVTGNKLVGNTSFIGSRGPNCTKTDQTPTPQAFVIQQSDVDKSTTQFEFVNVPDGDSLTCILPPDGGSYWPYGGNPEGDEDPFDNITDTSSSGSSKGRVAGIAVGVILGFLAIGVTSWFLRRWAIRKRTRRIGKPRSYHGYSKSRDFSDVKEP